MWRGALPEHPLTLVLLCINTANLAVIVLCGAVAALRGLASARMLRLSAHVLGLPIYWALMSLAAWQALVQYFRQPFAWEKTPHGVARDRRRASSQGAP